MTRLFLFGELTEWLMVAVLKTVDGESRPWFESYTPRQLNDNGWR